MITRWFDPRSLKLATVIGVLTIGAASAHVEGQTPPPSSPAPAATEEVIQLNAALRAYYEGDYPTARGILEKLQQQEPNNVAYLYYLALAYLEEGLNKAGPGLDDKNPTLMAEARACFKKARGLLEKVVATDKPFRPIEAALNLGISRLASEEKRDDPEARDLAQAAVRTLSAYIAEKPSDGYGYFFRGIAYYRLFLLDRNAPGNLPEAIKSFREAYRLAVAADDQILSTRASYYQGLVGLVHRDFATAKKKLQEGVVDVLPEDHRLSGQARQLIKDIEKEEREQPQPMSLETPVGPLRVEGSVQVGQLFDSNVILLGDQTRLPRGIGRQYDYRFGLDAGVDVTRLITAADGLPWGKTLLLGVGGSTSNLWQPSIEQYQINSYQGRSYVNWEPVSDVWLGLEYDYTYALLGLDPFISSNRITPVVSYVWRENGKTDEGWGDERARTSLYYSYDYRDYFDRISAPYFDRDGAYHTVGVEQSFNLWKAGKLWNSYYGNGQEAEDAKRWLQVQIGCAYRNERTQGDEFDLYGNSVRASAVVPLPYRLAFDFSGEFAWDQYTQSSRLDFRRNHRDDFTQRYTFGLSRILVGRGELATMKTLEIKARAGVDLTIQDSNIWDRLHENIYSYDRTLYTLQLMINF
jgi:hypothetical protein